MDILGIGPMELILILIVALMVFGPDKLPQIGAKLGRAMRDMRKATRAISTEINATRDAVTGPAKELAEPFQDVADAAKTMGSIAAVAKNPGQALKDSVLKELNPPTAPAETSAPAERENTIASPVAATIAAASGAPAALPGPNEIPLALPAPDDVPLALPEPSLTPPVPPAEEPVAEGASEQTETATPPTAKTLPTVEPLPSTEPTVKKRKPRAKKPSPPADAQPGAGEQ